MSYGSGDPAAIRRDVCDLITEGRVMCRISGDGLEHGVFDVDVDTVLDLYEDMMRRSPDSHMGEVMEVVERFVVRMRHTMKDRFD